MDDDEEGRKHSSLLISLARSEDTFLCQRYYVECLALIKNVRFTRAGDAFNGISFLWQTRTQGPKWLDYLWFPTSIEAGDLWHELEMFGWKKCCWVWICSKEMLKITEDKGRKDWQMKKSVIKGEYQEWRPLTCTSKNGIKKRYCKGSLNFTEILKRKGNHVEVFELNR